MEGKEMRINPKIQAVTEELFGVNYCDDTVFTDERYEELEDKAIELKKEFSWKEIYKCWFNYLKDRCNTPEEVVNWTYLFSAFGGTDEPIDEPYKLGGFLLYKIGDIKKYYSDVSDIIERVIASLLIKGGYISGYEFTDFLIDSDPKILAELENWKKYYDKRQQK